MTASRARNPPIAKLCPPRLMQPMVRPRLHALLQDESRPVTWVAGPPGSGKTTLVAGWLAASRQTPAWYQVEPADAEPGHLFRYLGQLAATFATRQARRPPAFDPAQRGDFAAFARQFVRAFYDCLPRGAVLVLDNAQEAISGTFEELMSLLVDELPPHCRLFVLSHLAPGERLAAAVAHRRITVLGWEQLQFDGTESRDLLKSLRGHADGAEHLQRLANGWAAGLVLLGTQDPSIWQQLDQGRGEPQEIFGYFAETVFARLAAPVRRALMCCALMPRFTAAMATLVSEELAVEAMLEDAVRRRLFVEKRRASDSTAWYQFHPLFRAFLNQRLASTAEGDAIRRIEARAARVLADAGDGESAIRLLIRLGDMEEAAEHILAHAPAWLRDGRGGTLSELVDAVQDASAQTRAWLTFWSSMAQVHHDEEKARARFETAYAAFAELGDSVGQRVAAAAIAEAVTAGWRSFKGIERWAAVLNEPGNPAQPIANTDLETIFVTGIVACGIVFSGDSPALVAAAGRGLELLAGQGDINERLALAMLLVNYFDNYGPEGAVQQALNAGEALLVQPGVSNFRKATWHYWLACYFLQVSSLHKSPGALKSCEAHIAEAARLARAGGFDSIQFGWEWVTADVAMHRGEFDKAEQKLHDAARWLHASRPIDTMQYYFKRAHLALRRGDPAAGVRHLDEGIAQAAAAAIPDQLVWSLRWNRGIMFVRLGRYREAVIEAGLAIQHANTAHRSRCEVAILGYRALAALGERAPGSAAHVATFFRAMRQGGSFAVFTLLPGELARLAAEALAANVEQTFIVSLVRARALAAPDFAGRTADNWPWPVRVHVLGRFMLEVDGRAVESVRKAPRKPQELIKALAARGATAFRGVAVDALIDDLWPDPDTDDPKGNFDITLHRARKLLGHDEALLLKDGQLLLNPALAWTDCAEFERRLGSESSRALSEYSGSLLPGDKSIWAVRLREHWSVRFIDAVLKEGARLEAAGLHAEGVPLYERGLAQDNLVEAFYRGLMRCHLARDDRSEALRAYRRCREMLSIVLGIPPSVETERLREEALG
jgi:LuxR family transcriptional regulator, maltose regulon positive regulatory protein